MVENSAAFRQRRVADTQAWRARQKRGACFLPVEADAETFDLMERFSGLRSDQMDDKQAVADAFGRLWRLALAALMRAWRSSISFSMSSAVRFPLRRR